MDFFNAVSDYLEWMVSKKYSAHTIYQHELSLRHFSAFLAVNQLPWRESFTNATLESFKQEYGICRGNQIRVTVVKGFARYLHRQGIIASPIKPPFEGLPEPYESFLEFFEGARNVRRNYITAARFLLKALNKNLEQEKVTLSKIKIDHLDAFLSKHNRGYKPTTQHLNRCHLRNFCKYLYYERRIIQKDLAPLIVGATRFAQEKPPKFLRPQEMERIFAALTMDDNNSLRTAAMVHLAYSLGLRPAEVSKIRLDDIAFSQELIHLPDRKSDNPIKLPLPEETIKVIAAYVIGARPESRHRELFLNLCAPYAPVRPATVSVAITRALKHGNPQATAYWLRHTYAQNLLQAGVSVFEVKEMMGHDCIQSTRRYLHINLPLMRSLFDE